MWNKIKNRWMQSQRIDELSHKLSFEIETSYYKRDNYKSYLELSNVDLQQLRNRYAEFSNKIYHIALNNALNTLINFSNFEFAEIAEGLLVIKKKGYK